MLRTFPAILFTALLLAGCDAKYEIVRAGSQTFVLNKHSGDAQLVQGSTLVPVTKQLPSELESTARRAKSWPSQDVSQLGDIKLVVRTKYRDGELLYEVVARPFAGRLEREFSGTSGEFGRQPTLMIDFEDEDGFRAGEPIELKIRGGQGTRILNEKGEAHALSWTGSQPMSVETYAALKSQSVRWYGFSKD
jgi:hypothetical protein